MSQPANVMIECPTTGERAYTGWFIDSDLLDAVAPESESFHCDRCHDTHLWGRGDAIFETF